MVGTYRIRVVPELVRAYQVALLPHPLSSHESGAKPGTMVPSLFSYFRNKPHGIFWGVPLACLSRAGAVEARGRGVAGTSSGRMQSEHFHKLNGHPT